MPLRTDDFDYRLPNELIAQHPASERSSSRLLRVGADALSDHGFGELPSLLSDGDLLVFNDTRVIKARLYGRKQTGGRVEILVERVLGSNEALAQMRVSKPPAAGARLVLEEDIAVDVLEHAGELYRLRFNEPVLQVLEKRGRVPLPPYITHAALDEDESRYQTVYAREPGAVAAPTAGLHFDQALLDTLRARGIAFASLTLHVGAGTFQPVRVKDLAQHRMHAEWYSIPEATCRAVSDARRRKARIIAVGTTTVRALESAARQVEDHWELTPGSGETRLFIVPGYRFRIVERMITNFHLPRSTLLMLVCAFGGRDAVLAAYEHAVRQRYRFFSYGDAMLIDRVDP